MAEEFYNKNHDPKTGKFSSGDSLGSPAHKAFTQKAQSLAEKAAKIAYDDDGSDEEFGKIVDQYEKHITSGPFGEKVKRIEAGKGSYKEKQAMLGKVLGNWKNYDIPLPGPDVLVDAIY